MTPELLLFSETAMREMEEAWRKLSDSFTSINGNIAALGDTFRTVAGNMAAACAQIQGMDNGCIEEQMREEVRRRNEEFLRQWEILCERVGFLQAAAAAYDAACRLYLQYHRRLPGSDRTKRLRKKRRAKVLRWYANRRTG